MESSRTFEFGQVVLSPNDLVCLLPISEQLLQDANINLVQFITQLFAEAIGLAEDKAFFTGSGNGQPKGITQESITSKAVAGQVSFDDILDLIDLVPQRVVQSPKAAFVGHRNTKRALRKIKVIALKCYHIFMGKHIGLSGEGAYGDCVVFFENGDIQKLKDVVKGKVKGAIRTFNRESGLFEYKNITDWVNLGVINSNSDLLNIRMEGLGWENGSKNGISVSLTPKMKVLTGRGWADAYGLKEKEDFLVTSYESVQGQMRDVLCAMSVGDLHLLSDKKNSKNTTALNFNDSQNPDYVDWKVGKLSPLFRFHKNSLGMVSQHTHDLRVIKDEITKHKNVASDRNPLYFLDQHFSSLGLAIWIMDDGHFSKYGSYILSIGRLASHKGMHGVISWWFNNKGYENKTTTSGGGLRFSVEASKKIASEIYQYVPESMQYKLPESLRGMYRDFDIEYKIELRPEEVRVLYKSFASDRQLNKLKSIYNLAVDGSDNYMAGNHSTGVAVKAL